LNLSQRVGAPHIRQRIYWVALADTDCGSARVSGNAGSEKGQRRTYLDNIDGRGCFVNSACQSESAVGGVPHGSQSKSTGASNRNFWDDAEWLTGSDGKSRRFKPGIPMLAHGISNRLGRLRGYGNAIVPQVAAEFIKACDGL
jgi:DNA (cytosine-5)-methyltransferase 1